LRGIQPRCAPLPGAALNAPCPGYRFIAVCGPVAGQMRSIASGEFSHAAHRSRGRRLTRLARATGSPPSAGR
ncbi:hypothetical protein PTQ46_22710, partial [Klebsiella michiganensis]|uniref:hypothetical protein n=1 Tax=Klebsiella michiganensis TaxID=1134687 RepID=UPI00287E441F